MENNDNSDCPTNALYFKLYPKAVYFKGPKNIRGYISPEQLLEEYKKRVGTKVN